MTHRKADVAHPAIVHGLTHHPLYRIWQNMKGVAKRTNTPVDTESWPNPKTFVLWGLENGWEPGDRFVRNSTRLGYSPDNCFFAKADIRPSRAKGPRATLPTGVYRRGKKYAALLSLGVFDTPEEAAQAYEAGKASLAPKE